MFCMKILLILPKFHEKTLSRSGDIKIFCPGRRMYMYTLPLFLRKTVNEMGENIPGENFLGASLPGGMF